MKTQRGDAGLRGAAISEWTAAADPATRLDRLRRHRSEHIVIGADRVDLTGGLPASAVDVGAGSE
jgi:hypothetical protein